MEDIRTGSLLELPLDYDGGRILKETARWSRFLSIVGIVSLSLMSLGVLILLFAGAAMTEYFNRAFGELFPTIGASLLMAFLVVMAIIFLAIVAVLVFTLYRFSKQVRAGIEQQDQVLFNQGLKSLKNYFLISGIIGIVSLVLSLFTLI